MRSLHREDGEVGGAVGDLNTLRGDCLQPAYDLRRGGGVGHEVQVVVRAEVDDQVVDDTATGVVTAQRVLRPARPDATKIIGQALVDESFRPRPAHIDIAQMTDVEDTDGVAYGEVLLDDAGVLDRHLPATELRQLGTEGCVSIMER